MNTHLKNTPLVLRPQAPIVILPHTRKRLDERGGCMREVIRRVRAARRQGALGKVALVGDHPIIVADIRPKLAIVKTVLDRDMWLKSGTQVWVI